jgi:acetyltransferase-like isoleucine patch superfamily enzyme
MQSLNSEFLGRDRLLSLGVRCGGEAIQVHVSVVLIDSQRLQIGNHVRIDPFCILSARGGISLGQHIHIAAHCSLIGGGGIEINDFAGISHGAKLLSVSDDLSGSYLTGPTIPDEFRAVIKSPIRIGRHAVVGAGSVILPGVTLGEGTIVGALSLVRDDLPPWTVWGGIPARQIGTRRQDLLTFEEPLRNHDGA